MSGTVPAVVRLMVQRVKEGLRGLGWLGWAGFGWVGTHGGREMVSALTRCKASELYWLRELKCESWVSWVSWVFVKDR